MSSEIYHFEHIFGRATQTKLKILKSRIGQAKIISYNLSISYSVQYIKK